MLVLGIDTTARRGGVALVSDGETLASRSVEAPKGFGDVLYPLIAELLAEAGVELAAVDLFAAASGPGSFTGVRVGLTAAKALAEALGKPALAVSNLEALAAAADRRPCAVVSDARRGEVYGAVFGEELEALTPETVTTWAELRTQAQAVEPLWVAADSSIFEAGGAAELPPDAPRQQVDDVAAAVARLALLRPDRAAGKPEAVEANYIRRPDAERNWKGP